jgi:hypothetical protein
LILGLFPPVPAEAALVDSIDVVRNYNSDGVFTMMQLTIRGDGSGGGLNTATVTLFDASGKPVVVTPIVNIATRRYYEISGNTVAEIDINGTTYDIGVYTMPKISTVTPRTLDKASLTEGIVINGNDLKSSVGVYEFMSQYQFESDAAKDIPTSYFNNATSSAIVGLPASVFATGSSGLNSFLFKRNVTQGAVFINLTNRFVDQLRLVTRPTILNLEMFPNRAQAGDTITLQANASLDNYDVFFKKDYVGIDPYTNLNKGVSPTPGYDPVTGKFLMTVRVPTGLALGTYYVVLTNKIPSGADPQRAVTQETWIKTGTGDYDIFTVVESTNKMRVETINPNQGPYTGTSPAAPLTDVLGWYFGRVNNINGLTLNNSNNPDIAINGASRTELQLDYLQGGEYNTVAIANVRKKITVIVGNTCSFRTTSDAITFEPSGKDTLHIEMPQVNDAETNPVKDVVIETTTQLLNGTGTVLYSFREQSVLTNGYTYISGIRPTITSVTPEKVDTAAVGLIYQPKNTVNLTVTGTNFYVSRFQQSGNYVTYRPYVTIEHVTTGGAILHKITGTVYNVAGQLVDGTTGNTIGTRLVFQLPNSVTVESLGRKAMTVTNYVPGTDTPGEFALKADAIEFVSITNTNEIPVIQSVSPETVQLKGGDKVTVNGQNFLMGVKVYLNGKEITGVTRDGVGQVLTFNAPASVYEGTQQLQVVNPGGGAAIADLTYVQQYTEPTITNFDPKSGTTNTFVVVNGTNFLPPNPSASAGDVFKLIGARVFLGTQDVNTYNGSQSAPVLENFTATSDLFSSDGSRVTLAPYAAGLLLEDGSGNYYRAEQSDAGKAYLRSYSGALYEVRSDLHIYNATGVNLGALTQGPTWLDSPPTNMLTFKTYYAHGSGAITGNRVQVRNTSLLYFQVPDLPSSGFYDLIIRNPDSSAASKTGTAGFNYSKSTASTPTITGLTPNIGAVTGGYYVDITGTDFRDDKAGNKVKIYVNGVTVPANDVFVVSPVLVTIKMPAFTGTMQGTNRMMVPVVAVNPDSGTAFLNNAFTYVIPDSTPRIVSINPTTGNATGGQLVEINGLNFYFPASGVNPLVYFGRYPATITGAQTDSYLQVTTPVLTGGTHGVYVINSDYGMSNIINFIAKASAPKITSVVPAKGRVEGREAIEINGSEFAGANSRVRFGNIGNAAIQRDRPNSGLIVGGKATVVLEGGLTVTYDAALVPNLALSIESGLKTYSGTSSITNPGGPIFYDTALLQDGTGTAYPGYEHLRLEIKDNRLLIERGYSPLVTGSDTKLTVFTSTFHKTGVVTLSVFNPDGGKADVNFEYVAPVSNPVITNVQKEGRDPVLIAGKLVLEVVRGGGNTILVTGTGFEADATIQIGDIANIPVSAIKYTVPTNLEFTMPAVPDSAVGNDYALIVNNPDGAVAFSTVPANIWIRILAGGDAPVLEKITPDKGPVSGGTQVRITGQKFQTGLKVYFDGVLVSGSTLVDSRTIALSTPPHAQGTVAVKVENPDGTVSNTLNFTYLSEPTISAVVDPLDETANVREVSVNGGTGVKIKGSGFINGARVVFVPVLEGPLEDITNADVFIKGQGYKLVSGTDGTVEEVAADGSYITLKAPAGKLGEKGLIVINADGGATAIWEDITFVLDKPQRPLNVRAELVQNYFIRINWDYIEGATRYDIYMKTKKTTESAYGAEQFVGSTATNGFVFTELSPKTSYIFIIRTVGGFGSSEPGVSNAVGPTGDRVGIPDDDGKPDDKTSFKLNGEIASIIIGSEDFADKVIEVDLLRGNLAGAKRVIIQMPAAVVTSRRAKDVVVRGKDFTFRFNPQIFNVGRLTEMAKQDKSAGVRLAFEPFAGNTNLGTFLGMSTPYTMRADAYAGNQASPILTTVGKINMNLDYNKGLVGIRRLTQVQVRRHNPATNGWETIATDRIDDLNSSIGATIDNMGRYIVTGSR